MQRALDLCDQISRTLPSHEHWGTLVEGVREMLQAELAFNYQPVATETGWDLAHACYRGEQADSRRARHGAWVRSSAGDARSIGNYDPYDAEPEQRNRALTLSVLRHHKQYDSVTNASAFASGGVGDMDQLRALLCEGGRVTAWVGALRREPFTQLEQSWLQAVVAPLRGWVRMLAPDDGGNGRNIDAVMESVPGCAFLVDGHNRFAHINRNGLSLLSSRRDQVREAVLAARARRVQSGVAVTYMDGHAAHGYLLIVITGNNAERAFRAGKLWNVTPKQQRVLALLSDGKGNKDIAAAMGCAEVTVEKHLTALFRLSSTRSRAELLVKLSGL